MEVLIIIIIVIAVLISIIKEHSGVIIAILLIGGYLYIANKFGIGIIKAILGAIVFALLFGLVVNILLALISACRKSRKRKVIKKISRYFRHCKPTDDYNFIKQKAFRKWGGIDFKLGALDDRSDFYIKKELNTFVESVRVPILNDILVGYHEKGAVDDEFVTDMCRRYGRYCIGDITIRSFITSILIENGSKKTLDNGEIVFIVNNSTGGTNFKINDEISEDDL